MYVTTFVLEHNGKSLITRFSDKYKNSIKLYTFYLLKPGNTGILSTVRSYLILNKRVNSLNSYKCYEFYERTFFDNLLFVHPVELHLLSSIYKEKSRLTCAFKFMS